MERELTDDEINKICMYMRVIDLMRKNLDIINKDVAMKKQYDILCKNVEKIMELLSAKQKNHILEIHRLQLIELAKRTKNK